MLSGILGSLGVAIAVLVLWFFAEKKAKKKGETEKTMLIRKPFLFWVMIAAFGFFIFITTSNLSSSFYSGKPSSAALEFGEYPIYWHKEFKEEGHIKALIGAPDGDEKLGKERFVILDYDLIEEINPNPKYLRVHWVLDYSMGTWGKKEHRLKKISLNPYLVK